MPPSGPQIKIQYRKCQDHKPKQIPRFYSDSCGNPEGKVHRIENDWEHLTASLTNDPRPFKTRCPLLALGFRAHTDIPALKELEEWFDAQKEIRAIVNLDPYFERTSRLAA